MTAHSREEVEEVVARYCDVRRRIDAEELPWNALAQFFTDDCVYIDPAWGRVEGIGPVSEFFEESMRGLEDWDFPIEFAAIDGDNVVVKWVQMLPGARPTAPATSSPARRPWSTRVTASSGTRRTCSTWPTSSRT